MQTASRADLLQHTAARFAVVGALCALLTLSTIYGLKAVWHVADLPANAIGYAHGLAFGFVFNKRWTFRHRGDTGRSLLLFLAVFALAYLVNIAFVTFLIRSGVNAYLAHGAGILAYTAVSYPCNRWLVFASRRPKAIASGEFLWLAASLAGAAVVVFHRLGVAPIDLWDESRLANNALEMARTGLSLVTTFDGAVDHWNTKPPLLIWLMALAIQWLGATELAVRLPSALAALATVALVHHFCAARLAKPHLGLLGAMLLLSTSGYVLYHGARSGDYDAMLTLFTTAYVFCAYRFIHHDTAHASRWLVACALGVALAFLTKTIQGLLFLPALIGYAVIQGRLRTVLLSRALWLATAFVATVVVGYYTLREHWDPGYFAVAQANDLQGRFTEVLDEHHGGFWWYLLQVEYSMWLLPGLASAAWLAWHHRADPQHEHRRLAICLGMASGFYLLVISLARTKLPWYPMPVYPLMAVLVATALDDLIGLAARAERWSHEKVARRTTAFCLGFAVLVVTNGLVTLNQRIRHVLQAEPDQYSIFLRGGALREAAPLRLVVLHPGYPSHHDRYYTAPTLFYVNTLRHEGRTVRIQSPDSAIASDTEGIVICGSARDRLLQQGALGEPLLVEATCGLYRRRPSGDHSPSPA